jgi:hypothetical protein
LASERTGGGRAPGRQGRSQRPFPLGTSIVRRDGKPNRHVLVGNVVQELVVALGDPVGLGRTGRLELAEPTRVRLVVRPTNGVDLDV